VSSIDYPVPASTVGAPLRPGDRFAVASVTLCAGPSGAQSLAQSETFVLNMAGGTSVTAAKRGRSPNAVDIGDIGPKQCVHAYVTFQATGAPTSLSLNDDFFLNTRVWRVEHG
jgi:hypothetical protein